MNHQGGPGGPMSPVVGIGKSGVEGEIVLGVRVHLGGGDGVEAFRGLPVALLALGTQLA